MGRDMAKMERICCGDYKAAMPNWREAPQDKKIPRVITHSGE